MLVGTYVIEINSDNNNRKAWSETVVILMSKEGKLSTMECERSHSLYTDPSFVRMKTALVPMRWHSNHQLTTTNYY